MTLDIAYLNRLREMEMQSLLPLFSPGARILEFGAGTGQQAKFLAEREFEIVAVDLPASTYAAERMFPILDYDGERLPLASRSVDVIFSSNVLEHVEDLPAILAEFRRVLRAGGICLHVLPTPAWRFWTFVTGLAQSLTTVLALPALLAAPPAGDSRAAIFRKQSRQVIGGLLPRAHGTDTNGIAELWSFSRLAWRHKFRRLGFDVIEERPLGLFYTGNLLLGPKLSDRLRYRLSGALGSAVRLYVLRPVPGDWRG